MGLVVAFVLAGCSEPPAGSLRTDREGLYDRMASPTTATDVRWMTRAATSHGGTGRADAQVYAWLTVSPTARTDLTSLLGPTMGRTLTWLPDEVAGVLLPAADQATLLHNPERKLWRLEGERFPPENVGKGDYRGQVVLLTGDRLYVSLGAR